MVELNSIKSRTYSRLGQRGAIFGMAVNETAANNPDFILLTADLATLSGLDRYIKQFPRQFVNVGIAEQNMVGMGAGLAAEGFLPCMTTYATFLTMRSCEQIRHYFGYMGLKGILIGSGAGLSQGFAGNTHYTIEDMAIMRAVPNITILSPADAGSAVKVFEESLDAPNAVYIRLTGTLPCPIVYKTDAKFTIGRSNILRDGSDIVIIACGTMVSEALKAADILAEKSISASVIDMYSIKPIDTETILNLKGKKMVVTVEEHSTIGGLGGAVAEVICAAADMPRMLKLGISDKFDLASDYKGLLIQNRLTAELIAEDIVKNMSLVTE